MTLILSELGPDETLDSLVRCEFASYENPLCKLLCLFFPPSDFSPDVARESAIQGTITRQTEWHKSDPTSTWLKVVDSDSGNVVGGACWHVYETNPYATESNEECYWWAAGEDRDIANDLMGHFLTPRTTYMRKPHVFLDVCYTHPDYRRRGVGNLLLKWGIEQADAKGLEAYVDATELGRDFYRSWGFIEKKTPLQFSIQHFPATKRRDELEEMLIPFEWWPMYRPLVDAQRTGDFTLPWDEEKEEN